MNEQMFGDRAKKFALQAIRLPATLPRSRVTDVMGRPLDARLPRQELTTLRACRGKSASDVIAKLGIVEDEADESIYWMELLLLPADRLTALRKEADELVAMTVAPIKTLRNRK